MPQESGIWTIGHSNLPLEEVERLLHEHRIEYVIDVRSYPYSNFVPQFNREALRDRLVAGGVHYLFMGDSLGGRPGASDQYDDEGHALYAPMSKEPAFVASIERLIKGAERNQIALLCSCGNPEHCHRRLLVGKVLVERGIELRHILSDSSVRCEREVDLQAGEQTALFGGDPVWRSTQSVSHRRRLSISSVV